MMVVSGISVQRQLDAPYWLTPEGWEMFMASIDWVVISLLIILVSAWITVGLIIAFVYEEREQRIIAGVIGFFAVFATWYTTLYKIIGGLLWPYVLFFAVWVALSLRFGRGGTIGGGVLFYVFSVSTYVWPHAWSWAMGFWFW